MCIDNMSYSVTLELDNILDANLLVKTELCHFGDEPAFTHNLRHSAERLATSAA